jgi:hypothetical protein
MSEPIHTALSHRLIWPVNAINEPYQSPDLSYLLSLKIFFF